MFADVHFLTQIINNMNEHIVVIDLDGKILFSNRAWDQFGRDNQISRGADWREFNYLDVCDEAAKSGDDFGTKAAQGLREIISQQSAEFYFEYPCHSPDEKRWFMMRAKLLEHSTPCILIDHTNITERKSAEEIAYKLSLQDHLTGIANRRKVELFAEELWASNQIKQQPICLAIIDLDCFKKINDHLGHNAGDKALQKVANLLKKVTNNPNELCARLGGDEFIALYAGSSKEAVYQLLERFQHDLKQEKCDYPKPCNNHLTTSIGVACLQPTKENSFETLLELADKELYKAKEAGRNCISMRE